MIPPLAVESLPPAFVPMESRTPAADAGTPLAGLTRRMARGEEEAFASFHQAFFQRLFRYVLVLTRGDEHGARDVTQETLLRVVRHVRVFEEETVFWAWLTCLARSAAADHGRRTSRYRRLLDAFRPAAVNSPEIPSGHDLEEAMVRALARLPRAEAELLTSTYYERNSVRATAARLDLTEAAVESRLVRARKLLRQTIFHLLHHERS